MAKTNKELKLNMPLAEWLSRYTKDELVEMADLVGLGVPDSDSARKDELIEDVEEHIRYSADEVLGMTSVFELEFLHREGLCRLCDVGRGEGVLRAACGQVYYKEEKTGL